MQTRVDLTITFGARIILVVKGGLPALIMLTAPVWQDVNCFLLQSLYLHFVQSRSNVSCPLFLFNVTHEYTKYSKITVNKG